MFCSVRYFTVVPVWQSDVSTVVVTFCTHARGSKWSRSEGHATTDGRASVRCDLVGYLADETIAVRHGSISYYCYLLFTCAAYAK